MLSDLIPQLAGRRILVVGDVCLDEYLTGAATRLSREAPVPVLEFESRRLIPGGAANPAASIVALGSTALQAGVTGADPDGATLRDLLAAHGIDATALITDADRPTTVKTRIMAQMGLRFPQQIARLDRLSREPIRPNVERALQHALEPLLATVDAVLCSDYRTGLLTPSLVAWLRAHAAAPLTADAQGQFDKYRGFALVKCNAAEAADYLRRELHSAADFADAARTLCARLDLTGAMVITRGAAGVTFARPDGTTEHCPAPAVTDVFDTVGAGDTAIAVLTLAHVAGIDTADGAQLANYASGLVVRRFGNYAPGPAELRAAIPDAD